MLTESQPRNMGDILATVAAAFLFLSSFMPYWASLEGKPSMSFLFAFEGPTGFNAWDVYPSPVLAGVVVSLLVVVLGIARLTGRGSAARVASMYLVGGGLITLLMLYGVYEGPSSFPEAFLFQIGGGNDPTFFQFNRGPLIYVGVGVGLMVLAGGLLAKRRSRVHGMAEVGAADGGRSAL